MIAKIVIVLDYHKELLPVFIVSGHISDVLFALQLILCEFIYILIG